MKTITSDEGCEAHGVLRCDMCKPVSPAPLDTPKPGRIPDLEGARLNAEYWRKGAKDESLPIGERLIALDQAVNAWKNAAYAMADQRDAARSETAPHVGPFITAPDLTPEDIAKLCKPGPIQWVPDRTYEDADSLTSARSAIGDSGREGRSAIMDRTIYHRMLTDLCSLILGSAVPIGPMRSRDDYPPELAKAIKWLKDVQDREVSLRTERGTK